MDKTEAKQAMEELTMILMYLSRFADGEKFSEAKDFYAWKGYDFDVINKLWDEDYVRQGSHTSRTKKSIYNRIWKRICKTVNGKIRYF